MTTTDARPALDRPNASADTAVAALVDALQHGLDTGDADTYDSVFAADLLWGTPKGRWVRGYDILNPIHHELMGQGTAPASRFEVIQTTSPTADVTIAQIRRTAIDGGFSEMAMYVLVQRDGQWWLAAAQNTPVVDDLPS